MGSLWRFLRAAVRPGLPEPIPIAHWRRLERIGVWLPMLLAILNIAPYFITDLFGMPLDRPVYRRFLLFDLPGLGLIIVISAWARAADRSERAHRAVAMATVVLLHWTSLTALTLQGQLTLNLVLMSVTVGFYRVALDGRIGLLAFAAGAVGLTGLAIGQRAGWVANAMPMLVLEGSSYASSQAAVLTNLYWSIGLLAIVWLCASFVANRLRAAAQAVERERTEARLTVVRALVEAGQGRLSGSTLGGYHLIELLGRGAMGEVYAGERAGARVAVKVLHAHLAHDATILERFRRESEAARRVAAHTPELIEVGTADDGTPFIVMERLVGEDLGAFLRRRGVLTASETVHLVRRLATALDAAHGAGVIHRDLKPQNVFLLHAGNDREFGVKLLDFGISRLLDVPTSGTLTQMAVVGSPGYLSPEQARGDSIEIGAPTDVFALGAIAYRALTGQDAFPGRTAATAIFEALYRDPPAPSSLPIAGGAPLSRAVDDVLAIALAKTPAQRYASAGELARDLELALTGQLPDAVGVRARALPVSARPLPAGQTLTA